MADGDRMFNWADYLVFALTLAVSLSIGIYYGFKLRFRSATATDLLLGGRQMPVLPVAISIVAVFGSIILIVGLAAETFYGGLRLYMALAFIPAGIVAAHTFLPVFHRLQVTSVYEVRGMASAYGFR